MNRGAGHAATTERSLGIGLEAGMGLCTRLRGQILPGCASPGSWDTALGAPGDVGARSQPSQAAGNRTALLERENKQATPKFPPCSFP